MLIGRASEQQALERLISGARIGQSGVLVITGEPGVGKTALLNEAANLATGMGVLRANGSQSEREVPFGGLLQLLRPALGILDQIPAPQADALAAALALRPGRAADRFAIGAATLSLICRYAEERSVAILIDDLHDLDRPSAEAVAFAARRLMADPIVLLATARSAELTSLEAALPQLVLTGIDPAAAAALVSAHSRQSVPPELILRLYRATAGNPLALIELSDDLESLERRSPEAPFTVSALLSRSFSKRVDDISADAQATLLVAAIAGTDLRTVSRACVALRLDPATLAEAERAQIIRFEDDRVDFRHPLIRLSVYSEAGPDFRRSVHRAVADALPPEESDRCAWHLAESVLGPDTEVADRLEEAALAARDRSAHAVASAAHERAARLTIDADQRLARFASAAESAWLAGSGPRATALLDEIDGPAMPLGQGSQSEVRLRALELRGDIATRTGSLIDARDIFLSAARAAPSLDARVQLLADATYACFYLGDAPSALAISRQIESFEDEVAAPRARAVGATAAAVGRILANEGGPDQLRGAFEQFVSTSDPHQDERRVPWLMIGPLFFRDAESGNEIRRRIDGLRREAAVGVLPFMLFNVARDEAATDRWSRAEATYTESIRLAGETAQTTDLVMSQAGLAWLLARQGRQDQCHDLIAEALQHTVDRDLHLARSWLLFAMGDLDLAVGNPVGAVGHFEELMKLLGEMGFSDPDISPAPDLAEALMHIGRAVEARQVASEFMPGAVAKATPWALARGHRAIGVAGPDSDLDANFSAALTEHAHTLDGYETARTELAYGERLRRARRRSDARPHLRLALAIFEGLPAMTWADRAAAELEATGEPAHRSAEPNASALTPQELQISMLLAEGETTREVAAALFLSPKTVEYHLRKVYTKLGIKSRTELAAALGP